ncbi:hypothetical protein ACWEQ7_05695 [Streptomyces sp. NPDC004069]
MERVRARVGDKRVLALVKAFLKARILSEDGLLRDNDTGTPQGSILSPLLSNVALSVLDEHIAQAPGGAGTDLNERRRRRRRGLPNYRLVACPVREAAPGKRAGRKTGTAPRADFTNIDSAGVRCAAP